MDDCFAITRVHDIGPELRALAAAACDEDFGFMDRLIKHWESGTNRFELPSEAYFGVWLDGELVAAGGLNRDPYCSDRDTGRVRHVYVTPAARRSGAGSALMAEIIGAARPDFRVLRLRTTTPRGAAFYEALAFERCNAHDATHILIL